MAHKVEKIKRKVFESLLEYSTSNPTGTFVGKVWKRDLNVFRKNGPDPDWRICEYVDHPDPKLIGIDYRIPEIIEDV